MADFLIRPKSDYRVLEFGVSEEYRTLSIRQVHYDVKGKPVSFKAASPKIEAKDGDGLVALLNDLAEALTKPSLLESDFRELQ